MIDKRKPWERQKGEKNLWFDRFTRFRLMGPSRSLLALYRQEREEKGRKGKPRKAPTAWLKAAEKWDWRERAEAWDAHRRQEDEVLWGTRRRELREQEWDKAQALIERAELMLRHPLAEATRIVEEQGPDGRPVTVVQIIKPVRWRVSDVPRFLEMASKLARLAAGMETERQEVGVTLHDVLAGLPAEFRDAVCSALDRTLRGETDEGSPEESLAGAGGPTSPYFT